MTNEFPVGPSRNVFIGIAAYNRGVSDGVMLAMLNCTNAHSRVYYTHSSSAPVHGFNQMWQTAVNNRKTEKNPGGFTHFVMIHADVGPNENTWLERLIYIMNRTDAEILSVVLPIKTKEGLTSTALDEPQREGADPRWCVRRLTMTEIFEREPTFTDPKLLVNNGLMLVDLSKPWVEEVFFRTETDMIKLQDGSFMAVTFSEDWWFSREAAKRGAKIFATREVQAVHLGMHEYDNFSAWGTMKQDGVFAPEQS